MEVEKAKKIKLKPQKLLYGTSVRERDKRRTEERKPGEIKQLWDRSHEILRLALTVSVIPCS